MNIQEFLLGLFTPQNKHGSDDGELIFGSIFGDTIDGKGGDDIVFGLFGQDKISGGDGEDEVFGGFGADELNGGNDADYLFGGFGGDVIAGNKGNDLMFGGFGADLLVWNNGDGSDLMNGGQGDDRVQVNFNTDLVNNDLQNKDVAEFSVTDDGVQFARVELNDQAVNGLFQLDIRQTETLETNFGAGDDTARIVDKVLEEIRLELDGGDGIDLLDLSQAAGPVEVHLAKGNVGSGTAENFENIIGSEFDDRLTGDREDNVISGLGGSDSIFGRGGDDSLVANKGDDFVFGGAGDDYLVWNNGDGSDRMVGGKGNDRVQVNFNTDLVNEDLQNNDVAEFSVTSKGVQFARIELNDQTVNGLFQLDIRKTEELETNFGDGDDAAVIVDTVLDEILLDLDGGDGVDLLDFSQAAAGVDVNLAAGTIKDVFDVVSGGASDGVISGSGEGVLDTSGTTGVPVDIDTAEIDGLAPFPKTSTAENFENIIGTKFDDVIAGDAQDNVIRGGAGNDIMSGGDGADTFVFFEEDTGVDIILDFDFDEDRLQFVTTDPNVTAESLIAGLSQVDDDAELSVNGKVITFEGALVGDFGVEDFLIA